MKKEKPCRAQGMTSCLIVILVTLGVVIVSPACALTFMVYEQSDRTIPISQALIYAGDHYVGTTDDQGSFSLPIDDTPPVIRVTRAGYREWTGAPAINDSLVLVPLEVRNVQYTVQVLDYDTKVPVSGALITCVGDGTANRQENTRLFLKKNTPSKQKN